MLGVNTCIVTLVTWYLTITGSVWSSWSNWSACSVTCDTGTRFRARHCEGGTNCVGDIYQSDQCSLSRCENVVDGQWGSWSRWGTCSATCGDGIQARMRLCNNPFPQDGGKQCTGDSREVTGCKVTECPIDGGWSNFTSRPCSKTCGVGVAVFIRTCTEPAPKYGGKSCEGSATKFSACKLAECIIDGQWSSWTNYTACSVVCGDGHRHRYRTCTAPLPQNGGKNCSGHTSEMSNCNNGACPTDIKICDKQRVSTMLKASNISSSCGNGNDVTIQTDMMKQLCNAPSDNTLWKLGIAISENCEAIPIRSPIGYVHKDTKEQKYGILLDCYQQILEFASQTCDSGITTQTTNLNTSDIDYHLLLW